MNRQESSALIQVLKTALKTRGLSYRALAKQLKVSEPTMKRFFGSDSEPSLERILAICDCLGLSFFDVAEAARHGASPNTFLSAAQEEHFAKHPGQFGIFRDLYSGHSPAVVMRRWKLSSPVFYRLLRELERQELLEVLADNRVRFKVRGVVRWSHTGPMTKKLVPEQNEKFFSFVYQNMGKATTSFLTSETWMTPKTFEELCRDWQEIGRRYRERGLLETQTFPKDQLLSVRFAGAVAPFQTDWTRYSV